MRNVSTHLCRKSKHTLCSISFPPPPPENRAVYEIMCKNTLERERPQMTKLCMRTACCIPKATNTQSHYVILIHDLCSLLSHCNSSCTNASECYSIRAVQRLMWLHQERNCTKKFPRNQFASADIQMH